MRTRHDGKWRRYAKLGKVWRRDENEGMGSDSLTFRIRYFIVAYTFLRVYSILQELIIL